MNEPAPSWVAYAALAVSMAALVVSTAWGWYAWRRTGEALKVIGDLRVPLFQSARRRPVRTGEVHYVVTITVHNRGRTPVRIHRLWLASRNRKLRSGVRRTEQSAELPVTVEARDRVRWYVEAQMLGVLAKQHGNPMTVRPLIEYGPGVWKEGRLLRIAVPERFLPAAAPRFKATLMYRLRSLRRRKGVGPVELVGGEVTLATTPLARDSNEEANVKVEIDEADDGQSEGE